MWPPVRSAGFAGPFTPLALSLRFKRIPCFYSSSSQGWVSQPGLGRSWVDSRLALPTLRHQVWGNCRKRCWDYQKAKGSTWWEGSPLGLNWWEGRVEGKNKGSLSAAGSPDPLAPDFQTPGPLWARLRPSKTASPFSNPNQVSPLFVPQNCSRPGWGWEAGCQGKYEAPASRRWLQLYPGAHTPCTLQGGGRGGKRGGGTQHLPPGGRNVGNGWVS